MSIKMIRGNRPAQRLMWHRLCDSVTRFGRERRAAQRGMLADANCSVCKLCERHTQGSPARQRTHMYSSPACTSQPEVSWLWLPSAPQAETMLRPFPGAWEGGGPLEANLREQQQGGDARHHHGNAELPSGTSRTSHDLRASMRTTSWADRNTASAVVRRDGSRISQLLRHS